MKFYLNQLCILLCLMCFAKDLVIRFQGSTTAKLLTFSILASSRDKKYLASHVAELTYIEHPIIICFFLVCIAQIRLMPSQYLVRGSDANSLPLNGSTSGECSSIDVMTCIDPTCSVLFDVASSPGSLRGWNTLFAHAQNLPVK